MRWPYPHSEASHALRALHMRYLVERRAGKGADIRANELEALDRLIDRRVAYGATRNQPRQLRLPLEENELEK